jgi:chromosomal replication initiation ATPase DnaA
MTFVPKEVHNARILVAVADKFNLPPADLAKRTYDHRISRARQTYMYVLREAKGYSSKEIGRVVGRDHSTVLHGWARVEKDPIWKAEADHLAISYMDIPTFSDRNFYL